MKAISDFIKRFVKYVKLDYYYRKAVKKADALHEKDNGLYFVMPNKKGDLIVLSWQQYKKLRRYGKATRAVKDDLFRECFYCTKWKDALALPKIAIQAKRKMYFEYYLR